MRILGRRSNSMDEQSENQVERKLDNDDLLRSVWIDFAGHQKLIDQALREGRNMEEIRRLDVMLRDLECSYQRLERVRSEAEADLVEKRDKREEALTSKTRELSNIEKELEPLLKELADKEASFSYKAASLLGTSCKATVESYEEAIAASVGAPPREQTIPVEIPEEKPAGKAVKAILGVYACLVGIIVIITVMLAAGFLTYSQYRDSRIPSLVYVLGLLGPAFVAMIGAMIHSSVRNLLTQEMDDSTSGAQRIMTIGFAVLSFLLWATEIGVEAYGIGNLVADKAFSEALLQTKIVNQAPFALIFFVCFIFTTPYFGFKGMQAFNEVMPRVKAWRRIKKARELQAERRKLIEEAQQRKPLIRDQWKALAEIDTLRDRIEPLSERKAILVRDIEAEKEQPELSPITARTLDDLRQSVLDKNSEIAVRLQEL